jgi:hypothetical protein
MNQSAAQRRPKPARTPARGSAVHNVTRVGAP